MLEGSKNPQNIAHDMIQDIEIPTDIQTRTVQNQTFDDLIEAQTEN